MCLMKLSQHHSCKILEWFWKLIKAGLGENCQFGSLDQYKFEMSDTSCFYNSPKVWHNLVNFSIKFEENVFLTDKSN